MKKLKFKKGTSALVDAKRALPEGWKLNGELNVILWRRRSLKGDTFRAEVPGMPGVYGEEQKSPKTAIQDLMHAAVETCTDFEGDELTDLGPSIVGTAVDLRTKLQPRKKSHKA